MNDRTTKARIRDAAICLVADEGLGELTARRVAEAVDVSPGSVIHHFGSMEGLREACDHHVVDMIRAVKTAAAEQGAAYDPMEALRWQKDQPPYARYIAEVVAERSPSVDALIDELVGDAVVYSEMMVESGLMKPSADPRGRAVLLVLWSLGNLVLRRHMKRLLGVDPSVVPEDPRSAAAYMGPMLELTYQGLITDASMQMMRDAFVADDGDRESSNQE